MAARNLGSLTLDLLIKTGSFTAGLDKAARDTNKRMTEIEKRAYKFGQQLGAGIKIAGVAAASSAAVIGGIYVKNTIEAEKVSAKLNARIKALGGDAAATAKEVDVLANAFQSTSTFDDEAITEASTALLAFTNVGADEFARTLAASLDLAAASGDDLTATAEKLGKALNEPDKAAKALRDTGIALSDAQKKLIKDLTDTGRVGEAQGIILGELEKRYKGTAEAARNTLGGALEALGNSFNNLLEGDANDAGLRGAVKAIQEFEKSINDPSVKAGIDSIAASLVGLANSTAQAIGRLSELSQVGLIGAGQLGLNDATNGALKERRKQLQANIDLGKKWRQEEGNIVERLTGGRDYSAYDSMVEEVKRIDALLNYQDSGNGNGRRYKPGSGPGLRPSGTNTGTDTGSTSSGSTRATRDDTEAQKKNAEALRERILALTEFDRAQMDAEETQQDWARALEDLTANMAGPGAEANLAYTRQLADLNAAVITGAVSAEDRVKWEKLLGEQFALNKLAAEDYGDVLDTITANEAAMESLGYAFEDAFAAIGDGASSAKEIVGDFFDSIYQDALKWLGMQARLAIFGGGTDSQGNTMGSIFDLFSSFGGGLATGGTALPGKFYRVNESGMEMATVDGRDYLMTGSKSAHITPNHKLGGGSTMINNFSLAAPTSQATQEQIVSRIGFQQDQARRRNS